MLKYSELTKFEKECARTMLLNAVNQMEREQAIDAGKQPKFYTENSPLFKQMLPETSWERYKDERGASKLRRA